MEVAMRMWMRGSIAAGLLLGCSSSFKGETTGVVPQKSPAEALTCLIRASEKDGYKVYTVDTVDTPGTAVMRKLVSAAEAGGSNPNEFTQGNQLRLETATAAGQVSATVTPFLVRMLSTRAGPIAELDPPVASGISDAQMVLSSCTGSGN
jgi:hypothetical protein